MFFLAITKFGQLVDIDLGFWSLIGRSQNKVKMCGIVDTFICKVLPWLSSHSGNFVRVYPFLLHTCLLKTFTILCSFCSDWLTIVFNIKNDNSWGSLEDNEGEGDLKIKLNWLKGGKSNQIGQLACKYSWLVVKHFQLLFRNY